MKIDNNNIPLKINLELFHRAVAATVHNEPHLRTVVLRGTNPPMWAPATDFSQVFKFVELDEVEDMEGAWDLVEKEVNSCWDYDSSAPLYRCTLMKTKTGYIVMNCYHHSVGDGSAGRYIMDEIMKQYERMMEGKEEEYRVNLVKEVVEDITRMEGHRDVLEEMKKEHRRRIENYKPILNYDVKEIRENEQLTHPLNKTLWREGSEECYKMVRERCKREKVTVGSMAAAAAYLALGAVHIRMKGREGIEDMKDQFIDMPVNLRSRVEPKIGDSYVGLYISELAPKITITLESSLWGLSRQVVKQLAEMIEQNQHLLYCQMKEELKNEEMKTETYNEKCLSNSCISPNDIFFSNKKEYLGKREFGWGRIRSIHSAGSYWVPAGAGMVLMIQSTDFFTYNLVHSPGETNAEIANQFLDNFVTIMEELSQNMDNTLEEILNRN